MLVESQQKSMQSLQEALLRSQQEMVLSFQEAQAEGRRELWAIKNRLQQQQDQVPWYPPPQSPYQPAKLLWHQDTPPQQTPNLKSQCRFCSCRVGNFDVFCNSCGQRL
jgi:hypothetical protein